MTINYEGSINVFKSFLDKDCVKINESMKFHTTFKLGGPCDIMVFPKTENEFISVMREILNNKIPYFILGSGSNIIVKDGGIRGVVVNLTKFNNIKVDGMLISCDAGAKMNDVSSVSYENSLTGFECFSGIPGTIGGAVTMNAGAYGGEISSVINKVKVMNSVGDIFEFSRDDMEFSYRTSNIMKNNYVLISCDIILKIGDKNEIKNKIDDLTKRRSLKQPLEYPSAGSIFKRPHGYFAGKLIDDSNLRGYVHKNAMVSSKHCGFIINKSNAKTIEVLELIEIVRSKVYENFNVNLELEVKIVGED